MKSFFSGLVTIVVITSILAGLLAFSTYAHRTIEKSENKKLSQEITSIQSQKENLETVIRRMKNENNSENNRKYDLLVSVFTGEKNEKLIHSVFYGVEDAEDKTEEELDVTMIKNFLILFSAKKM